MESPEGAVVVGTVLVPSPSVSMASSEPPLTVPDGEVVTVTGALVVTVTGGAIVVVVTGAVAIVVVVVGVVVAVVVVVADGASNDAPATPTTVDAATAEVHTTK